MENGGPTEQVMITVFSLNTIHYSTNNSLKRFRPILRYFLLGEIVVWGVENENYVCNPICTVRKDCAFSKFFQLG